MNLTGFFLAIEKVGFPATQCDKSAVTFIKDREGRVVFHNHIPLRRLNRVCCSLGESG